MKTVVALRQGRGRLFSPLFSKSLRRMGDGEDFCTFSFPVCPVASDLTAAPFRGQVTFLFPGLRPSDRRRRDKLSGSAAV